MDSLEKLRQDGSPRPAVFLEGEVQFERGDSVRSAFDAPYRYPFILITCLEVHKQSAPPAKYRKERLMVLKLASLAVTTEEVIVVGT